MIKSKSLMWLLLFLPALTSLTACRRAPQITQEPAATKDSIAVGNDGKQANKALSPLISVDELQAGIKAPEIRILEIGKDIQAFEQGHIPGAQYVDWVTDITDPSESDRYNIIPMAMMEKLLGRLGVQPDSRIIIYDRLNSRLSTRMYWTLKIYNHDHVQIVDGGFEAWAKQNTPTETLLTPAATVYKIEQQNDQIATDLEFIRKHLDDPNVKFVDGRPVDQFTGKKPGTVFHTGKEHLHRGHIPGAVNVFWKDNFNPDGTFKSKQDLQHLYDNRGITADGCVVTYCNEGLHAAPPWFVLTEILGYDDVRVYDDSMSEWANADNPMEKSADPSK